MTAGGRVLGAVEFWVAVVAAIASVASAVIANTSEKQAGSATESQVKSTPTPTASVAPGDAASGSTTTIAPSSAVPACLRLIERTRAWAANHPQEAALYTAVGDADTLGLPNLWSGDEVDACGGDPERLLEATKRRPRP